MRVQRVSSYLLLSEATFVVRPDLKSFVCLVSESDVIPYLLILFTRHVIKHKVGKVYVKASKKVSSLYETGTFLQNVEDRGLIHWPGNTVKSTHVITTRKRFVGSGMWKNGVHNDTLTEHLGADIQMILDWPTPSLGRWKFKLGQEKNFELGRVLKF